MPSGIKKMEKLFRKSLVPIRKTKITIPSIKIDILKIRWKIVLEIKKLEKLFGKSLVTI